MVNKCDFSVLAGANGDECERIAVKHLVPTTSPERIWMELDCLRVANGRDNVIPLLFGHRSVNSPD